MRFQLKNLKVLLLERKGVIEYIQNYRKTIFVIINKLVKAVHAYLKVKRVIMWEMYILTSD